jgi:uroporphyrinogen-III decarboxylase
MSTETMTSRERLMAALRHEEVDRVPWSPLVCGYFSLGLPDPIYGNDLEAQRAFGADIMERISTGVWTQSLPLGIPIVGGANMFPVDTVTSSGNIEVKEIWKGDQLLRIFETPVGAVREIYEKRPTSPWMAFPVEFKIKTVEDLKVYRYIVEALEYKPAYETFIRTNREIGDEGIATTPTPVTAFQMILEVELGVERFHYFLADYPKEMEEAMEVWHAKNLEACKIIAESPAEVVIIYENTSTSYMSPPMFKRYILNHLNEYADLFHDAGKMLLVHACGKLKGVAEDLTLGRYDGICDMAPPPTGDMTLAQAKGIWGDKLVATGGIDGTAFAMLSPDEMKKYVWRILEEIAPYRGVILGSADAVPYGTPLETLRAVTEAVKEFKLK